VRGGAWDIDDLPEPAAAGGATVIARHESLPLASLAAYFMKVSQNFYAETILKTRTRRKRRRHGRRRQDVVRQTLESWASQGGVRHVRRIGLVAVQLRHRGTIVAILKHMWQDLAAARALRRRAPGRRPRRHARYANAADRARRARRGEDGHDLERPLASGYLETNQASGWCSR